MKRLAIWTVPILALLALSTGIAGASNTHNPAGNNGTIKIDDEVMADKTPENNPHVNCVFSVQFYGYDKDNSRASVNFALQAPTNRSGDSLKVTSGNLHPSIGGQNGGGNTMDASEQYTLSFTGTPQKNQGYHVKVTVAAPGSQGNDTKQKVFWVQPCAQGETTTTTTTGTTTTPSTTNENGHVLGEQTNQPTELPNTGSNLSTALMLSGTSTVAGYAFMVLRRLHTIRG